MHKLTTFAVLVSLIFTTHAHAFINKENLPSFEDISVGASQMASNAYGMIVDATHTAYDFTKENKIAVTATVATTAALSATLYFNIGGSYDAISSLLTSLGNIYKTSKSFIFDPFGKKEDPLKPEKKNTPKSSTTQQTNNEQSCFLGTGYLRNIFGANCVSIYVPWLSNTWTEV